MNRKYPVYTLKAECQDCYRCVRECPVKAIKIEDGRASVVPELCISCGKCVAVCSTNAKKVRDDLGRVKHLIESNYSVFVSLAPSWISEFPNINHKQIVAAIKSLGFIGVSETAIGAQYVSAEIAKDILRNEEKLVLSSACPAAVDFIKKYMPEYAEYVSEIASPLLTHTRILKKEYGEDIKVVFIGPCVAKKTEADCFNDEIAIALTFQDLRRWFEEEEVDFTEIEKHNEEYSEFVPYRAKEGALYPYEGGMIESLNIEKKVNSNAHLMTVTGIRNIKEAIRGLNPVNLKRPVFVECLACDGGCINGPCTSNERSDIEDRIRISEYAAEAETILGDIDGINIKGNITSKPIRNSKINDTSVRVALRRIGKKNIKDELNCGGCGYESCRAFANALIEGKAEPAMCVSFMRNQANKKANALLRCMPSGVVIVDEGLRIVESNRSFANIFGEDTACAFEASPGLEGARLEKIIPFDDLFRAALRTGEDILREHFNYENKLLNITIFTIERGQVVGAIIQDVTSTELRREQIACKAREVINKNLATVQEIACMLGEHMADTEILLRSIADDYSSTGNDIKEVKEEENG
jgi:iron only hydrogenase large subunit-like protein